MEAHWDGSKPGALVLFAWPDEKTETQPVRDRDPEGRIARSSRTILDGLFPGLKSVPPAERPPVVPVFFAFRIMVGIGFMMIAFGLVGAVAVVARHAVRYVALVPLARRRTPGGWASSP